MVMTDGGVLDRAGGRQPVAAVFIFDVGPQHAGRVQKNNAVADVDALLALGDSRFVACFGNYSAGQYVDQRGFSDIGYAHDQRVDESAATLFCRQHLVAQLGQLAHFFGLLGGQRQGFYALFLLQIDLPLLRNLRVGKIAFTEHFDAGLVAAQVGQHRVLAAERNARVQNFDDQVNLGQDFFDFFAGLVHMAGVPLNEHDV